MTPSQGNLVFMLSLFYSVPLPTCHSPRTKQRFPSGKAYRSLEIYISFLERLTPQCGWIQVNEPILCTDMADRHWVFRPEMREKHNYRGVLDGMQ